MHPSSHLNVFLQFPVSRSLWSILKSQSCHGPCCLFLCTVVKASRSVGQCKMIDMFCKMCLSNIIASDNPRTYELMMLLQTRSVHVKALFLKIFYCVFILTNVSNVLSAFVEDHVLHAFKSYESVPRLSATALLQSLCLCSPAKFYICCTSSDAVSHIY